MASDVLRCPLSSPPARPNRRRAPHRGRAKGALAPILATALCWTALGVAVSSPALFGAPVHAQTTTSPTSEGKAETVAQPSAEGDTVGGSSPPADEAEMIDEETGKPIKARELRRRKGIDPCRLEQIEGQSWIDRINRGLHRAVCSSALWFDDLFGNEIYENYDRGTYGRLLVGLEYDDREDFGEVTRFRAKFDLPKAEQRLSGFIGRGDRDEIVSDQVPRTGALPNLLSLPDEDEWLVGLGYAPQRSRRNSDWSIDVGADIEFPINWYAKARYKHVLFPTDATMLRYRQTLFWEKDDGWGVTSRVDWDFLMANEMLLRWRSLGTMSEGDRGLDWYSELTLFQNLGEDEALAYQVSVSGETDAPVPVEHILGRVIYRRSILREWFFLDVRPGVSYRRDEGDVDREFRPILAVGFEILFGRQPK